MLQILSTHSEYRNASKAFVYK